MSDEGKVSVTKVINEASDSIEIGTPGKNGCVKIYGDFNKPEEFKKKIDNAKEIKEYANAKLTINF